MTAPRRPIRVAWVGGEPTPTRAPHLQALAARPEIDLSVVYATQTYQQRTWSVRHPEAQVLRGWSLPTSRVLHHDYPITPGIWRFLGDGAFDLVVIAGWAVFAAQAAIVWCRRHDVPYLLNTENHFREPRPRWVKLVKGLVLPRVVPQAAGMLVSGTLAREHALHYGARPNSVIVFPNTPDVPLYAAKADRLRSRREDVRSRLGVEPKEVIVLQVGRLIPVKGADVLISAIAEAGRHTSVSIRLVLTGEGPERMALERQALREGVPLTLTGQIEADDLVELYAAADIFCLLSRRETWGIVVNEAMACGLPLVLSSAVGASGDLLESDRNGMLVAPGDIGGTADAVLRLAESESRRTAFGARSRKVISEWGFEQSLDDFCELAQAVVDRRESSSPRRSSSVESSG
jgi:glycosyltransferase involved in cell wall biosynthesis